MQFLTKITNFYIFSNIHVALAGFCLTKITLIKYGFSDNLSPLFVFFSIVVSYNFIHFYEIKTNRIGWLKKWFLEYQKSLLILTVLSILGLVYIVLVTSFNLKSLLIILPFFFITLFYVVPLFKVRGLDFSFRNFPSIKIFSIVFSWAGISVLFPLYEVVYEFNSVIIIELVQRFFILIAITLPFDIRDVELDSEKLKTLPQILGVKTSKILGISLLMLFVLLEFFKGNQSYYSIGITFIIALVSGFFLWFSTPQKSRYYTSFWVEAIPILWLLLIVLFLKN